MTPEIIATIFEVCIIPLLGVLVGFLVKWINSKSKEIQTNIDNETLNKYLQMLTETVTDCVIATNQTYVESLKLQGSFDAEAQKQAFNMTCTAVLDILSDDAKIYLTAAVGDLQTLITKKIEAEVNANKITPA